MAKVQRSAKGFQGLIGWTVSIGHRRKGQDMHLLGQVVEVRCVLALTNSFSSQTDSVLVIISLEGDISKH